MYEAGYRSLIKYSVFLLLIPVVCWVINYSVGYVAGPTLYEGDTVAERKCRECCGRKTDPNFNADGSIRPDVESASEIGPDGPCPFCRGKGTVEVILPGSKRPTRFWGAIIDRKTASEEIDFSCPRNIAVVALQAAFLPPEGREIPGAIPNARAVFVSEAGDAIETKADAYGRYSILIPPGVYRAKISAPGFLNLEETLRVEPLTEPVWMEKAMMRQPDETAEASRSSRGIAIVAVLGRTEDDRPSLRLYPVP